MIYIGPVPMSALPSGLLLFFFACSSTLGCFNGRGGGEGAQTFTPPPIVQALFPPTENDKDPTGKGNGGGFGGGIFAQVPRRAEKWMTRMLGREIVPKKLGAKPPPPPYPFLIAHGQFQFAFPLLPLPNSGSFQEIPTNTCDVQTLAPFSPSCAKLLWENVGRKKGGR